MRALIWLIGIFALAVGLAMAAGFNDGYVLVVLPPWRAQLSLNLLIVLLLLGFLLAYAVLRLISRTMGLPRRVVQWRERRRREKAGRALREALRTLFEGRFSQALKFASNAFSSGESPAMAALVAARAAHAMRDDTRYRIWIGHAADSGEEARVARLMTEAELAVEGRRFEEAAERLEMLKLAGHRHIAALRLALRVASALERWDEALRLTRQLHKHKALSDEQAAPLIRRAHVERLKELAADRAALAAYWLEIPADELQDRRLVERAMPLLAAAGEGPAARRTLERLLDEEWDSGLARLYAHCGDGEGDPVACLAKGEGWLKRQPRDAGLLFSLGRLCMGAQLWGKAQSYLEASLSLAPTIDTHLALASLLEQLERPEEAQRHYRAAAVRVAG
ncbi:heme biosynthesis protein HemY [Azoarcus sp. TTM-91]|uniref:heme biosynthesis HemY N-terminal domain-containing protein n=1 Tax=Azoarcus sp. TTM-91 TaxID=2691581 RepID=UPI00145E240E|nr:heme biosynthesis HemY N-terminal domain-containing protein [Azoarcus sp. TTM-91]NMG33819.1 heme biosynthesis protein HemY [Azoarcus sp. TTM-91]